MSISSSLLYILLYIPVLSNQDRIDLDHVVAMGHSYGGATTVVTLAKDQRFQYDYCILIFN